LRHLHPFLPEELGEDFDLDEALRYGTLPVIWTAPDRGEALTAYAQLYLKEEIQAEALVRNLPGFARFLPVAALSHGEVVNVSGISRDAGAARTTVADYREILEDTLLAFRLPAFEARLRVRERRHPKLYWADAGLPRAMKRQLGPPTAEERGRVFEGWVASVLRAYRDYRGLFEDWGSTSSCAAAKTSSHSRSGQGGRSSMPTCAAFVPSRTCRTSCAASSSAAATAARRRRMGSTSCRSRPSWPICRGSRYSLRRTRTLRRDVPGPLP